ncbi:YIP1 family protein [candidate division KSB1 bacterium]|nr:YIP1 family protein [candidate division KSB1 bacterium]
MDQFTPAETRQPNVFEQIIGVFLSPTKTFQAIDQKPNFLVPLILIILVSIITAYVIMPTIMPAQMEKQREKLVEQGMSDEQIDQAMATGEKFGSIFGLIGAGFSPIIMLLIAAGLLMFICSVIMGGTTSFAKVFSIMSYSWLIYLVGSLVKIPLILKQKTSDIHFSPATFWPEEQAKSFLYHFLKAFDIFAIWQYVVLAIGVAIIYKFSNQKAGIAVGILFLIFALFGAAMSSLFM